MGSRNFLLLALAILGVNFLAFVQLRGEQATPVSPAPSVEEHLDQISGPAVERTHAGMDDETVPGLADAKAVYLKNQAIAKAQTSGSDRIVEPNATSTQRGCVTRFIGTNFSSRGGRRPAMFVLHYTVSANRAGFSDLNAIRSWFSNSRAQASSNYIIDFEGNCYYIVRETSKAWTQGFFNPWSISIEFIATGRERVWDSRGLRKGARVVADALKRWGIPLRRVNPSGCTVRAGITDHNALECGNTHTDVRPYFPWDRFMRYVREAAGTVRKKVRFQLVGPKGGVLATSSTTSVGARTEAARLRTFLDNKRGLITRKLREGKPVTVKRRVVV